MDLSTQQPQIVKAKDGLTATRYTVVAEKIDLKALEQEKVILESELIEQEPDEKELIEMGKAYHPYYMRNTEEISKRITQINELLK
jgi:hypothetical protein